MTSSTPTGETPCPCGLGPSLAACCGPYINGERPAPTPEALMRSRFSAFTLGSRLAAHEALCMDEDASASEPDQDREIGNPARIPGELPSPPHPLVPDAPTAPSPSDTGDAEAGTNSTEPMENMVAYLLETHHPDFREPHLKESLTAALHEVTWLSLEVRTASINGDKGDVEFTALYQVEGQTAQLQEHSSFVRQSGQWLYTAGEMDPAQNGLVDELD